jgi:hypothetical protein
MNYLKHYSCNHNTKLQQQIVSCWVKCGQIHKRQIVVQAVHEGRHKI